MPLLSGISTQAFPGSPENLCCIRITENRYCGISTTKIRNESTCACNTLLCRTPEPRATNYGNHLWWQLVRRKEPAQRTTRKGNTKRNNGDVHQRRGNPRFTKATPGMGTKSQCAVRTDVLHQWRNANRTPRARRPTKSHRINAPGTKTMTVSILTTSE